MCLLSRFDYSCGIQQDRRDSDLWFHHTSVMLQALLLSTILQVNLTTYCNHSKCIYMYRQSFINYKLRAHNCGRGLALHVTITGAINSGKHKSLGVSGGISLMPRLKIIELGIYCLSMHLIVTQNLKGGDVNEGWAFTYTRWCWAHAKHYLTHKYSERLTISLKFYYKVWHSDLLVSSIVRSRGLAFLTFDYHKWKIFKLVTSSSFHQSQEH